MAVIHVLDKHTAELIAAGEVVERPSSVVKELVENAIDAGADRITVAIERGGITSISVQDNGSGIEAEYISTAFIRHATSKIEKEQDLTAIGTLGFRGEALASISSVSRVEVLTKTAQDEFACLYRQEGGEEVSVEAAARPVGTTITVRDLFYNVPARMKFLKKDQSEAGYVSDVVLRQSLAHPEICFTFVKDGKEQFQTPGDGKLLSSVGAALGREFAKNLMAVDIANDKMSVSGVVTAPIACRGSRGMQFFYVNGRYVQNSTMMAALETAYKGLMMQGRFPGCVLNIKLPYELVDVNVHPAKTEVRFARSNDIFDLVYQAVRGTVNQTNTPRRELQLSPEPQFVPQPKPLQNVPPPTVEPSHTPIAPCPQKTVTMAVTPAENVVTPRHFDTLPPSMGMLRQTPSVPYSTKRDLPDIEKMPEEIAPLSKVSAAMTDAVLLLENTAQPDAKSVTVSQLSIEDTAQPETSEPLLRYIGEAFKTYLITQMDDQLILIDKHAAHERILYEKLLAGYGNTDGQLLMKPVSLNLSAEEKIALLEAQELLRKAGFEIEDFGGNSILIRAIPVETASGDLGAMVEEIAHKLVSGTRDTMSEKTNWILHSVACRAAIKAGDHDRAEALLLLAQDILSGKVPPFCPHGRPVLLKISRKDLEKQFGRLG